MAESHRVAHDTEPILRGLVTMKVATPIVESKKFWWYRAFTLPLGFFETSITTLKS